MRAACAALRQGSSPEWAETPANEMGPVVKVTSGSGRDAPRARPRGDAPDPTTAQVLLPGDDLDRLRTTIDGQAQSFRGRNSGRASPAA
jgi:hypothetical protein